MPPRTCTLRHSAGSQVLILPFALSEESLLPTPPDSGSSGAADDDELGLDLESDSPGARTPFGPLVGIVLACATCLIVLTGVYVAAGGPIPPAVTVTAGELGDWYSDLGQDSDEQPAVAATTDQPPAPAPEAPRTTAQSTPQAAPSAGRTTRTTGPFGRISASLAANDVVPLFRAPTSTAPSSAGEPRRERHRSFPRTHPSTRRRHRAHAGPDAHPDAHPDADTDAGPDAHPDAGPDTDTHAGPDAHPDAGPRRRHPRRTRRPSRRRSRPPSRPPRPRLNRRPPPYRRSPPRPRRSRRRPRQRVRRPDRPRSRHEECGRPPGVMPSGRPLRLQVDLHRADVRRGADDPAHRGGDVRGLEQPVRPHSRDPKAAPAATGPGDSSVTATPRSRTSRNTERGETGPPVLAGHVGGITAMSRPRSSGVTSRRYPADGSRTTRVLDVATLEQHGAQAPGDERPGCDDRQTHRPGGESDGRTGPPPPAAPAAPGRPAWWLPRPHSAAPVAGRTRVPFRSPRTGGRPEDGPERDERTATSAAMGDLEAHRAQDLRRGLASMPPGTFVSVTPPPAQTTVRTAVSRRSTP